MKLREMNREFEKDITHGEEPFFLAGDGSPIGDQKNPVKKEKSL